MKIEIPEVKRTIQDYDIVCISGMMIPISIDLELGDTIQFGDKTIQINLVPKPSINDPFKTLPAEDITIFMAHVVSVQHRTREVVQLTVEQQAAWRQTFEEMTKH